MYSPTAPTFLGKEFSTIFVKNLSDDGFAYLYIYLKKSAIIYPFYIIVIYLLPFIMIIYLLSFYKDKKVMKISTYP